MRKQLSLVATLLLAATSAKAETPKTMRLNLAVLDHGDCYLKIEEPTKPIDSATKFDGMATTLSRFSNAEVLKSAEGQYRFVHSFDHPDDIHKIFWRSANVGLNTLDGVLLLKPSKDASATATYWGRIQLPLILSYDQIVSSQPNVFMVFVDAPPLGQLTVNINRTTEGKTFLSLGWRDFQGDKLVDGPQILPRTVIDAAKGFEHKFRLPLPNSRIDNSFNIIFDAVHGAPQPTQITHLLVQGGLVPNLGVEFNERTATVFVSKIYPGTISDKAGLKEGDIIITINDQEQKTVADAASAIAKALGDELIFKIKRAEQEQEIKLKVE